MDNIFPEGILHPQPASQYQTCKGKSDKNTEKFILKEEKIFKGKIKYVKRKHPGEHMYNEVRDKIWDFLV
jgi:hypothetical protein